MTENLDERLKGLKRGQLKKLADAHNVFHNSRTSAKKLRESLSAVPKRDAHRARVGNIAEQSASETLGFGSAKDVDDAESQRQGMAAKASSQATMHASIDRMLGDGKPGKKTAKRKSSGVEKNKAWAEKAKKRLRALKGKAKAKLRAELLKQAKKNGYSPSTVSKW